MLSDIDLRALAQRSGPERAYLSLYLSDEGDRTSLETRAKTARAVLTDETERTYFDENWQLLQTYLDEHPSGAQGRCVFVCWAADYVEGFEVEHALPNLLWVDSSPYIRPLAELQDEYETFVVVAADNTRTRVFLVTDAHPDEERRVRGDVKNSVKVGGWSQQRYARRREKELHAYTQEVADVLRDLDGRARFDRIVLLGTPETLRELHDALPQDLEAKTRDAEPVDLDDEDAVWDEAFAQFFEEKRADERALWERIQAAYLQDGPAVVGAESVLEAARVGRIEALLVTRDAKLPARRCTACEHIATGKPDACPVCGSEEVFTVDLVNELAELMEATSARTEFADPFEALEDVGHVAALLRY